MFSANTWPTTCMTLKLVRRALIEMTAVRLRDRFAVGEPPQQRDGRVGEVIERQQQRRREMAVPASRTSSQPSSKPIGRLPTSPRNILATGLLNGAKPSIAPHSANQPGVARQRAHRRGSVGP